MEILIHNASAVNFSMKLQDIITSTVLKEEMHFTREIDAFTEALLIYRINEPIVLIQISNMTGIAPIMHLQDLLDDLFLIIVTTSTNEDLLRSCRRLYPRLLVSNKKDYELIDVVIGKYRDMRKA